MNTNPRESIGVQTEAAVLVGVRVRGSRMDFADPLGELAALAETAGARVVGQLMQNRDAPTGRTFLGKGKVEELAAMCRELGAADEVNVARARQEPERGVGEQR